MFRKITRHLKNMGNRRWLLLGYAAIVSAAVLRFFDPGGSDLTAVAYLAAVASWGVFVWMIMGIGLWYLTDVIHSLFNSDLLAAPWCDAFIFLVPSFISIMLYHESMFSLAKRLNEKLLPKVSQLVIRFVLHITTVVIILFFFLRNNNLRVTDHFRSMSEIMLGLGVFITAIYFLVDWEIAKKTRK